MSSKRANHASHEAESDGELIFVSAGKRSKQARYAKRTCTQCQARKTRCEGGHPYSQCAARGERCVADGPSHGGKRRRKSNAGIDAGSSPYDASSASRSAAPSHARAGAGRSRVTTSELLDRLTSMERQMNAMIGPNPSNADHRHELQVRAQSDVSAAVKLLETAQSAKDEDRQTFLGEISVQGLVHPMHRADDPGAKHSDTSPASNCRPLTPKLDKLDGHGARVGSSKYSKSWLREMRFAYGAVPEQLEFKKLVHIFFEEVYILYLFLHPPSVRNTLDCFEMQSFLISLTELEDQGESKMSTAVLFICLALGRCIASIQTDNVNSANSIG